MGRTDQCAYIWGDQIITPANEETLPKFYITATTHLKLKKPYDATPHIKLWQLSPTLQHTQLILLGHKKLSPGTPPI